MDGPFAVDLLGDARLTAVQRGKRLVDRDPNLAFRVRTDPIAVFPGGVDHGLQVVHQSSFKMVWSHSLTSVMRWSMKLSSTPSLPRSEPLSTQTVVIPSIFAGLRFRAMSSIIRACFGSMP